MKHPVGKIALVLVVLLLLCGYEAVTGAEVIDYSRLSSAERGETIPDNATPVYFGDTDNDGDIEIGDAILILRYIVKLHLTDDPDFLQRADVNLDGVVNIRDAIMVLQKTAGFIPDFIPVDPAIVSTETALRHVLEGTAVKAININGSITLSDSLLIERDVTIGTLLINVNPDGGGAVEISGTLGEPGSAFNLEAVPAQHYQFTGWTSAQELISMEGSIDFTMPTGDTEITANFLLLTYDLVASSSPPEAGTVEGCGQYTEGTGFTLEALPAEGFVFIGWTMDGEIISRAAKMEYSMPARDVHIVAVFFPEHLVPIASAGELDRIREGSSGIFGAGTIYEGEYEGGLDKHYLQCSDIDLGVAPYNEGDGWEPIGGFYDEHYQEFTHPFTGSYQGNGYRIKNLTIDNDDEWIAGLFGLVGSDSVLAGIILEDVNVNGGLVAGALAGLNGGKVSDCYAAGQISGLVRAGGLVGYNDSGGEIDASHVEASVQGQQSWAGDPGEFEAEVYGTGGLVGSNEGLIKNSSAEGNVVAPLFVGGLVGYNEGWVEDSTSSGTVTEIDTDGCFLFTGAGGLAGASSGTILRSHACCTEVSGYKMVGGLVGVNVGSINACHVGFESAENGMARVTGVHDVGGLVGANLGFGGIIRRCYATAEVIGTENTFDFLDNLLSPGEIIFKESGDFLSAIAPQGLYDGQYLEIPGVGGLAGLVIGGRISDYSYAEGLVTGGVIAGGLVGSNINGDIADCYSRADVHGPYYAGGFAGIHWFSEIYCSNASGRVVGTDPQIALNYDDYPAELAIMLGGHAGGFVAGNIGKISCSSAVGEVCGYEVVGGMVAINADSVEECFSSGDVINTDCETEGYFAATGGLVGVNLGEVADSYSFSHVEGDSVTGGLIGHHLQGPIQNCYATGAVEGLENLGGLVGLAEDSGESVQNCYFDRDTTGLEISDGGEGRSTAEMNPYPYDPEEIYPAWDFISIWDNDPARNDGYPFLRCLEMIPGLS
ncbi:MAG: hypothetical protein GX887_06235 [Firmicutes bacterium]|nr:hypothetical protein [Bacillota bacterium]